MGLLFLGKFMCGMILYDKAIPLNLIHYHWIVRYSGIGLGIWGAVVVSGLVWKKNIKKSGKILMMIDRSDGVQQLILNPPEGRFILAM